MCTMVYSTIVHVYVNTNTKYMRQIIVSYKGKAKDYIPLDDELFDFLEEFAEEQEDQNTYEYNVTHN